MAQIVLHIDIKRTKATGGVSQTFRPALSNRFMVSISPVVLQDLTFNLGTRGPQKEKVSET